MISFFIMCNWFFSKYACVIPLIEKKCIPITNAFKKFQINLIENQAKYGYIKEVNFTTYQ